MVAYSEAPFQGVGPFLGAVLQEEACQMVLLQEEAWPQGEASYLVVTFLVGALFQIDLSWHLVQMLLLKNEIKLISD